MLKKLAFLVLVLAATVSKAHAVQPWDQVGYSTFTATGPGYVTVVATGPVAGISGAFTSGANNKIIVLSYDISCGTSPTLGASYAWGTTPNGTILTSTITLSNQPYVGPYIPNGSIKMPKGQPLVLSVGPSPATCTGDVVWSTTIN